MAAFTLQHPRARCVAWMVMLTAMVLAAFPVGTVAKTQEQLLSEAIAGSDRRTVTYVLTTSITLTKELPAVPPNAKLTIKGACGARHCVIDGAGRFKIFFGYGYDCSITLQKLKLQNGVGGAVNTKCNVLIQNCTVSRNKGGGLFMGLGTSTWTIEDSLFEHNDAGSTTPSSGAAIFTSSTGRGKVVRTAFVGNRAPHGFGGGVYMAAGGDDIVRVFQSCRFVSNVAKSGGGAVYINTGGVGDRNPMRVYFLETTFEKNVATAGNGGAVGLTSPVSASFCGSTIANKQNRAVKGNDLALVQNEGNTPIRVSFCPQKPLGLSVNIAPSMDMACVLKTCIYCGPPS